MPARPASSVHKAYQAVEDRLQGAPDTTVTVLLVLVGLALIAVGLFSRSSSLKVGALMWAILP